MAGRTRSANPASTITKVCPSPFSFVPVRFTSVTRVTSAAEPVKVKLPIDKAGVYIVEVEAHDNLERAQVVRADLYAGGQQPVSWAKPVTRVFSVFADKTKYDPGMTAAIVLQSPFQNARALAVVEAPEGNRYQWVDVQGGVLPPAPTRPLRVGIAARPVDPCSVWLHHKTTRREVYDAAVASRPDCDDVLLWNDRGELTESSVANVIVEVGGQRLTPPLACGALPGVERARAIAEGRAREAVVRLTDLRPGQRLWLVSSLRGVREARLVG